MINLKGSDFDSKKSLLDAIRAGFPGGSVTFGPGVKNEQVNSFWHWLVSNYESGSGIKVLTTDHLGAQKQNNYWIVNEEVSCLSGHFLFVLRCDCSFFVFLNRKDLFKVFINVRMPIFLYYFTSHRMFPTIIYYLGNALFWLFFFQTHLWKNAVVPKHERLYHVMNIGKLISFSTEINLQLLHKDVLLGSIKR